MKAEKLTDRSGLVPLVEKGWAEVKGKDAIEKTYEFKSFMQAFGWMSQVAMVAERLNHHPEWSNTYNKVSVTLTTHDAGGLSDADLRMAKRMDAIAASMNLGPRAAGGKKGGAMKGGKGKKAKSAAEDDDA